MTTITDPSTVSGMTLWLDADAETAYSDGADITTWHDQSGGGKDFTTAVGTGAAGPTQVRNDPSWHDNVKNGLAVVRFDSSNGECLRRTNDIFDIGGGTTFIVGWYDQTAFTPASYRSAFLDAHDQSIFDTRQGKTWRISPSYGSLTVTFQVGPNTVVQNSDRDFHTANPPDGDKFGWRPNEWSVFYLRSDGTYVDAGVSSEGSRAGWTTDAGSGGADRLDAPTTLTGKANSAGVLIGDHSVYRGHYLEGEIGEVLHYNTALTDTEVQDLINYLSVRWGLAHGYDQGTYLPYRRAPRLGSR